jgi:excisionase family DNA binding protein
MGDKGMVKSAVAKPVTVTVKTAKEITGLGYTKIFELIKKGELKSVTIGRRRLIDCASLEALITPKVA